MVITTSPLVKTYTLQEFWALPEPADHSKLELIKGVLYVTPPPDYAHNRSASDLIHLPARTIERCKYRGQLYTSRAALWIDDDTYLEPDLMYISDELMTKMDPRHWTRADIVIEIISPSTAFYDRRTKSDTYRAMGVRELWLIDTLAKEIEVRSFEVGRTAVYKIGGIIRSEVLTKTKLRVSAVFRSLL